MCVYLALVYGIFSLSLVRLGALRIFAIMTQNTTERYKPKLFCVKYSCGENAHNLQSFCIFLKHTIRDMADGAIAMAFYHK